PRCSPLFPYTTLFRSDRDGPEGLRAVVRPNPPSELDADEIEELKCTVILQQGEIAEECEHAGVRAIFTVAPVDEGQVRERDDDEDRKSTRLNSSHVKI